MASDSATNDLSKTITVYGRNAVFEALGDQQLECQRLHWATSNRQSPATARILSAAAAREVPIREHSRATLARISRNGKQDQGVALDIVCRTFSTPASLLSRLNAAPMTIIAMDGITNPQNVGMLIRSAAAAGADGILYPRKGVASLGPLVIKASAGALFNAPIVPCDLLNPTLATLQDAGAEIIVLDGGARETLFDYTPKGSAVFVLGGETSGVSESVSALADRHLAIPLHNGVESLNVAVAGALVCYHGMRGASGNPV